MLDASLARDDLRPNKTVCLSHIFDKLMFEVTLFFYKKIKKDIAMNSNHILTSLSLVAALASV